MNYPEAKYCRQKTVTASTHEELDEAVNHFLYSLDHRSRLVSIEHITSEDQAYYAASITYWITS